jgi:putative ABC transport system permease protein
MRWFHVLALRLRAVFGRRRLEREMEAELADHLHCEIEERIARGASPSEARAQARASLGRLEAIKEECRDSRGTAGWEELKRDIAFGLRRLVKKRTFSSMALATMALGIGSTTAVFSLIDAVLIRPLPFPDPQRLFHARDVNTRGPFDMLRANSRLAEYAAFSGVRAFNTAGRDWPERWKGSEVSANFFRVLGVNPLLGRTFAGGEDQPGKAPVVVLSHWLWAERFASRPEVIGQSLLLDETAYQIAGVMPRGFQYPAPAAAFWIPMRLDPRAIGDYWGSSGISTFARLRPGVGPAEAEAELRAWIPRIRALFPWRMPDEWGQGAGLMPLRDHVVAGARVRSLLLMGVAALVLLIAIVNVANLMIGQMAARRREFILRTWLGATPGRLARQLLAEAAVLAAAGGVLGTTLAFGQLALLKRLLPDTPRLAEAAIDGRVLAFAAAVSLASGLLFGLAPAWPAFLRRSPAARQPGRSTSGAALVVTEAAFATILLVASGLLLRSFWTMLHVDPGFRADSVVTAELSPGRAEAVSLGKLLALDERVRARLAAFPGVSSVAAMNVLPLTPETSAVTMAIEDHPRPPEAPQIPLWMTLVTPGHLDTLGIRLLQGRGFTAADREGAPPVALIGRATAHRYWPGQSPIGKRLRPVYQREWRTIVGVVEDVRNYGIAGPPAWVEGEVYLPLAQALAAPRTLALVARTAGRPEDFEGRLPEMVKEVCANCAVSRIARMETVVANAVAAPRATAWLVGGFALLALALAAAGIYGVASHAVLRRTRELGVRLALGAGRRHVAWLVMGATLRNTLAGASVGLAVSWALARGIRALLFGIAEHDLASFALPPVLLVAVAIAAGLAPLCRALRIDPAATLREGETDPWTADAKK